MHDPPISIVIPTKNGIATLPQVLDAIDGQRGAGPVEVIAIDSGSTDGTLALLRARARRVIEIPSGRFNHGLTRNAAIEQTEGELVVLLVQDAIPASADWLTELIAPLVEDTRVAGTYARQTPWPDAGAVDAFYVRRWTGPDQRRTAEVRSRQEFLGRSPAEQFALCAFDNVCSCVRRSVWRAHPFAATPIAEDLEWARTVLLEGHRLVYVPTATVIHSHRRSSRYEFTRTFVLHRRLHELFGLRTIPTVGALSRSIATSIALHARCQREAGTAAGAARSFALAFAWPLGQYLGALSAVRGWTPRPFTGV